MTRGPVGHEPAAAAYHVVNFLALRAGRARVIGQNEDSRADRKVRQGFHTAGTNGDDSMFLARVADDEIWIRPALDVAHEAISLIDRMASCAAIARQGHPPAIDENPTLL